MEIVLVAMHVCMHGCLDMSRSAYPSWRVTAFTTEPTYLSRMKLLGRGESSGQQVSSVPVNGGGERQRELRVALQPLEREVGVPGVGGLMILVPAPA